LTLYHGKIKSGVKVIKNYRDVENIMCYPDELNQVWINLISNALASFKQLKSCLAMFLQRQAGESAR
jgi:C4-dicarboxylate-specific signal transduction histidine kinase